MPLSPLLTTSLAIALIASGYLILRNRKTLHDPADDGGEGEEVIMLGSMWEVREPREVTDARRVAEGWSGFDHGKGK